MCTRTRLAMAIIQKQGMSHLHGSHAYIVEESFVLMMVILAMVCIIGSYAFVLFCCRIFDVDPDLEEWQGYSAIQ